MFKKFFLYLFFIFLFFMLMLLNNYKFFSFNFSYFNMNLDLLNNFDLNFFFDKNTIIFIFMVSLVTCLVTLYSEIYMEHYNNKKFFMLMLTFFLFMSVLATSGSFIIFFLGWDGLGLSSICLIMFYPNKNTLYNSLLTMFFNRLGDVILILAMCKFLKNFTMFFFLPEHLSPILFLFLIICSFTKSAQFPFSSWLPAAMSAPTPISAMVHSSTLVTAGILMTQFFLSYYNSFNLNTMILNLSMLTFISGGFMGSLEMDFKKIIAFSTMSQISMIMLFCSLNLLNLSMCHMLFHAFFKTFLFMMAGLFFVNNFSKQMKYYMSTSAYNYYLYSFLFFVSIYAMSGLIFSSSFYSKDQVIENCVINDNFFFFFFLIMGSFFTIYYSSKLLKSLNFFINLNKIFTVKKFYFNFVFMFLIATLYSGQMLHNLMFIELSPFVKVMDLMLLNVLLILGMLNLVILKMKKDLTFALMNIPLEVFFMKYNTYSFFNKIDSLNLFKDISFHDSMIFKSFYLNLLKKKILKILSNLNMYSVSLIISLWITFSMVIS